MTGNKISKAIEQEILSSYEKLYRLAFSYVKAGCHGCCTGKRVQGHEECGAGQR